MCDVIFLTAFHTINHNILLDYSLWDFSTYVTALSFILRKEFYDIACSGLAVA